MISEVSKRSETLLFWEKEQVSNGGTLRLISLGIPVLCPTPPLFPMPCPLPTMPCFTLQTFSPAFAQVIPPRLAAHPLGVVPLRFVYTAKSYIPCLAHRF